SPHCRRLLTAFHPIPTRRSSDLRASYWQPPRLPRWQTPSCQPDQQYKATPWRLFVFLRLIFINFFKKLFNVFGILTAVVYIKLKLRNAFRLVPDASTQPIANFARLAADLLQRFCRCRRIQKAEVYTGDAQIGGDANAGEGHQHAWKPCVPLALKNFRQVLLNYACKSLLSFTFCRHDMFVGSGSFYFTC